MSDQSPGPGWWQASDDKWYPPETHPSSILPTAVPRVGPAESSSSTRAKTDGQGRRLWLWALPVMAVCTAIAVVMSFILGSSSDTSASPTSTSSTSTSPRHSSDARADPPNSTPHAHVDVTDLTGTYVGVGEGNGITMLLELTQSGSSLKGTLVVDGSHYAPTLGNTPGNLTGLVDSSSEKFAAHVPAFGLSFSGNDSGTSLTVFFSRFGDPEDNDAIVIVFQRGTISEFSGLTHKAAPSVTNVQVNLVAALKAAKIVYPTSQSFAGSYHSNGPVTFFKHAPELAWTTKPCNGGPVNCVSMRIFDVASDNDAQGIALAVYNSQTSTCWYAIDLEARPAIVANDPSAFVAMASDPNATVTEPGVYYARSPVGSEPSFCMASLVLNAHEATWGTNFASAGALR